MPSMEKVAIQRTGREGRPEREGNMGTKCKNEIRLRWRPYPEEPPKKTANCIVSISCDGTEYTTSSWWDSKEKQFSNYFDTVITAWAYMPRPYKKKKL